MFYVYATYSYGYEQDTDSVCLGNHWELMEADSDAEMVDYIWDVRCEQANETYHDEDEDEWGDHVEENSDDYVCLPYDPSKEGHVELSGYEDERPEYAALMIVKAARKRTDKIASLRKLIWSKINQRVDLQAEIEKFTVELQRLLNDK